MLIVILFHESECRCLKHFYLGKVCHHLCHLFPEVVSYNRFVELEKEVAVPLALFIKRCHLRNAQAYVLWTALPQKWKRRLRSSGDDGCGIGEDDASTFEDFLRGNGRK